MVDRAQDAQVGQGGHQPATVATLPSRRQQPLGFLEWARLRRPRLVAHGGRFEPGHEKQVPTQTLKRLARRQAAAHPRLVEGRAFVLGPHQQQIGLSFPLLLRHSAARQHPGLLLRLAAPPEQLAEEAAHPLAGPHRRGRGGAQALERDHRGTRQIADPFVVPQRTLRTAGQPQDDALGIQRHLAQNAFLQVHLAPVGQRHRTPHASGHPPATGCLPRRLNSSRARVVRGAAKTEPASYNDANRNEPTATTGEWEWCLPLLVPGFLMPSAS